MMKFLSHCTKSGRIALEIILALFIVLMIGAAFCLWHMSRQPFDLMFAEQYIERALSTEQYSVAFDDVDLKWPDMRGPLRLGIQGMTVTNNTGDEAISVQQADIGISSVALMAGMIRPVSLYVNNPILRLVRGDDGKVSFLVQGETIAQDEPRPIHAQVRSALDFLANPGEDSFLRRFRRLHISGAQLILEDRKNGEEIQLSQLNAQFRRTRTDVSASADMIIHDESDKVSGGISLSIQYNRDSRDMMADIIFKNMGPSVLSKLFTGNEMIERQAGLIDGRFALALDGQSGLQDFSGMLDARDIEIYWPQEYDSPLQASKIYVALEYDAPTQRIYSDQFSAIIQGVEVAGKIEAARSDRGYIAQLNIDVPEMAQETLESFFPKSEFDGELAEWLVHRMEGGTFRNVKASAPIYLTRADDQQWSVMFNEADMHIAFEAEGVDLTYQYTLMPARDIKGSGYFDGQKLVVNGESGRIEDVEARDVVVTVDDVAVKAGGYANILVHAKGPVSTLLKYIADEPIDMGDDIPFKPEEVKGLADIKVTVGLPTLADLPKEQVNVKVEGNLTDLYLPDVVQGLSLSDGPLALDTMEGGFTLKGDAKLDGVPVAIDMTQYFSSEGRDFLTKVDAKITSTPELRAKFGVDLSDFISGDAKLDVAYVDDGVGRESIAVTGDLTPARIHIVPFGYNKNPGTAGTLSLNATLDKGVLEHVRDLTVTAPDLSIKQAALTFRDTKSGAELSGGNFPDITIGETKGSADFTIDTGNVLTIDAVAAIFDAQPFLETSGRRKQEGKEETVSGQPMSVSLKAARVLGAHNQEASAMQLYTKMDDEGDMTHLDLRARVGKSDAIVSFKPDAQTGQRIFHLETDDGGALLAASGLYEDVRGGELRVFGAPQKDTNSSNLFGTAQLENFHVVRAPALAKLFGLMSLGGLGDLLSREGVGFSKLEADFEWRFQPQGNLLMVSNGRTSGSSVGLTFDGVVDRGTETTDIKGTIIPMTEINNVLKNIPLIGNILTGGSGLIAATYTMRGPSDDPSVMVNPLSVLAPGFLRTILFEGGFSKPGPVQQQADTSRDVKPPPSPSRTVGQ